MPNCSIQVITPLVKNSVARASLPVTCKLDTPPAGVSIAEVEFFDATGAATSLTVTGGQSFVLPNTLPAGSGKLFVRVVGAFPLSAFVVYRKLPGGDGDHRNHRQYLEIRLLFSGGALMRMHLNQLAVLILILACALPTIAQAHSAANSPLCNVVTQQIIKDPRLVLGDPKNGSHVTQILNNPSCFLEAITSANTTANVFKVVPAGFWSAVDGIANGQQQGSSLNSTGSANAVSKPSGPTSVAQEFGGLGLNSGTSSTTLSIAPGTTLTDLAVNGGIIICDAVVTQDCVSPNLVKALTPLTLKVTANTTTGSQTATGTPTTPSGSSSPAQPVTLKSHGSSIPSFSGFTVQYGLIAPKKAQAAIQQGPASVRAYSEELLDANSFQDALDACQAFAQWQKEAEPAIAAEYGRVHSNADNAAALTDVIRQQYQNLAAQMEKDATCQDAIAKFNKLFGAILAAESYDTFVAAGATKYVPALSLEYDLNTPQNQPSYSSLKATGTLQLGRTKTANQARAAAAENQLKPRDQGQAAALLPSSGAASVKQAVDALPEPS